MLRIRLRYSRSVGWKQRCLNKRDKMYKGLQPKSKLGSTCSSYTNSRSEVKVRSHPLSQVVSTRNFSPLSSIPKFDDRIYRCQCFPFISAVLNVKTNRNSALTYCQKHTGVRDQDSHFLNIKKSNTHSLCFHCSHCST